jgi:predicted RNase H-like HicB family nuclease
VKLLVTVERDEDGAYVAECPAIPGCVSQGRTEDDALQNLRDAIRECLEVRAERGMPLTVTVRELEMTIS